MAFWGKLTMSPTKTMLVVAALDGENIFRHAEQRSVDGAGFEGCQPILSQRHDGHISTGLKAEMLERGVGHQRRCAAGRAAADFFAFEILRACGCLCAR